MCEGEERVGTLLAMLKTCRLHPVCVARLESYQRLMSARGARSLRVETHQDFIFNADAAAGLADSFGNNMILPKWASSLLTKATNCCTKWTVLWVLVALLAISVGVILRYELYTLHGFARAWFYWENIDLHSEQCTVDMPSAVQDTFRPPVDCSMCADVSSVHRVTDITPAAFEAKYAYSGRPVVISNGQRGWSAPDVFSFTFFKSIYGEDSPVLFNLERECQFFPYQTSFRNLREVFNMSSETAYTLDGAPWYIGWSNCDSAAATVLREHYERPYFLPPTAEASKTDWIFMGTPGHGAHLHIDHVGSPSWQAQIRGRKRWTLEPPPECFFKCSPLQITVHPGEINHRDRLLNTLDCHYDGLQLEFQQQVVLDTNIWYHGTHILPGELSITIGSENLIRKVNNSLQLLKKVSIFADDAHSLNSVKNFAEE